GAQMFASSAEFLADARGTIDTQSAVPQSGTYKSADPDGLFWSMSLVSNDADPKKWPVYNLKLTHNGEEIADTHLPLLFNDKGVRVVTLEGTGLVGTLFLPSAASPRPAVIAYSGSEGGSMTGKITAAGLASEGFVALGLAYFGEPGLPDQLAN